MIPPTMTGTSPAPAVAQPVEHLGHQLQVRAGQDREADEVHVLVHRGRDDLRGGQPDPLVDDLEAGVAGPDGDLLGAVAVAVEAGLADEQPQPLAELLAGARAPSARTAVELVAARRWRRRPSRRRRWARGTRRTPRAGPRPTPPSSRRPARTRAWRAIRLVPLRASAVRRASAAAARSSRLRVGVALARATRRTAAAALASTSGSTVWIAASRSAVSGLGSVVSNLLTPDDDVLAGLDPRRRSECEATSADFM